MPFNIAIGTGSFAMENDKPLRLLQASNVHITFNRLGRRLNEKETIEILKDADGLIAGLEPLYRTVLNSAKKLRAIARVGIGMDNIDLVAAKQLGIKVSNTPDPPTQAVAEMTIGAMLTLCRRIIETNNDMHQGIWKKALGVGLKGTPVLIIGFGRNGSEVARLLRPFGADMMVFDPFISSHQVPDDVKLVSFRDGLKSARIITLHASGKDLILDEKAFSLMQNGVMILNSSRGEMIDEVALIHFLDSGKVSSVWLDVFDSEPYNGVLIGNNKVLLSPHNSTFTHQCRLRMEEEAVRNLLCDLGEKG